MSKPFPFLKAVGTHYEIGQQIGVAFDYLIKKYINIIIGSLSLSLKTTKSRVSLFIPSIKKHCPHLMEEIRGMADGAGISLEEALIPNIRSGINLDFVGGCSAYVIGKKVTADGKVLIGQNQDLPPQMQELGVVLHLAPEGENQILMWTFAGLLGYHGINDAGLAFFANSLPQPPQYTPYLPEEIQPGYLTKRLMLENQSIDGVLNLFDKFNPYPSPFGPANYVMCDRHRIVDIELGAGEYALINDQGKGYIAHTNHYISDKLAYLNRYTLPSLPRTPHEVDSIPRLKRFNKLLEDQTELLNLENLKIILRDHYNYPRSICRHSSENGNCVTVVSIIAEPERKRMHLCPGNPCEGTYYTYEM